MRSSEDKKINSFYTDIKEVPLFTILTRNISSNFFLSSCQYVSTIPEKKNCMLPTFQKSTFCEGL